MSSSVRKNSRSCAPNAAPARPKVEAPRFTFSLAIIGLARENNAIADYLRELKGCGLLKSVELEFIRDSVVNDESLRRFRIVCALDQTADTAELESIQQVLAQGLGPNMGEMDGQDGEGSGESGLLGAAIDMFFSGGDQASDEPAGVEADEVADAIDGSNDTQDSGEVADADTGSDDEDDSSEVAGVDPVTDGEGS